MIQKILYVKSMQQGSEARLKFLGDVEMSNYEIDIYSQGMYMELSDRLAGIFQTMQIIYNS